jgi:hypothetical protein
MVITVSSPRIGKRIRTTAGVSASGLRDATTTHRAAAINATPFDRSTPLSALATVAASGPATGAAHTGAGRPMLRKKSTYANE